MLSGTDRPLQSKFCVRRTSSPSLSLAQLLKSLTCCPEQQASLTVCVASARIPSSLSLLYTEDLVVSADLVFVDRTSTYE